MKKEEKQKTENIAKDINLTKKEKHNTGSIAKKEGDMKKLENTKGHFQNNADTDDMNKMDKCLNAEDADDMNKVGKCLNTKEDAKDNEKKGGKGKNNVENEHMESTKGHFQNRGDTDDLNKMDKCMNNGDGNDRNKVDNCLDFEDAKARRKERKFVIKEHSDQIAKGEKKDK